MLLGDNGVGKSTILKSLAIALTPLSDLMRYPEGRMQRRDAEPGSIFLFSSNHGRIARPVDPNSLTLALRKNPSYPLMYAYGAARGTALGGPSQKVDLDHPLGSVSTLFNQPPGLIHAETWLRDLAFGAVTSQGGADESFYEAVLATLVAVLPGIDHIETKSKEIIVEGESVGTTTLDGLSDGYLTTIGWICDLIARWANDARAHVSLDSNFNEIMTGLVLVDELDLHLHPRWQIRVIDDLRQAFPKMSFVVTTHNPLTLLGARKGEIQVLRRTPDGIKARQIDLPAGIRTDDVLTGPWFDLVSTLDADTRLKLAAYQRKAAEGVSRAELREDERQLRQRLHSFDYTTKERIARTIISEAIDEEPLTDESRANLKEKMKNLLGGG